MQLKQKFVATRFPDHNVSNCIKLDKIGKDMPKTIFIKDKTKNGIFNLF